MTVCIVPNTFYSSWFISDTSASVFHISSPISLQTDTFLPLYVLYCPALVETSVKLVCPSSCVCVSMCLCLSVGLFPCLCVPTGSGRFADLLGTGAASVCQAQEGRPLGGERGERGIKQPQVCHGDISLPGSAAGVGFTLLTFNFQP